MNKKEIKNLNYEIFKNKKLLEIEANKAVNFVKTNLCEAEIYIVNTIGICISTRYGKLESIEYQNNGILNINVYNCKKKGRAISTNLNPFSIKKTVTSALNISKYTYPDPFSGLPKKSLLAYKSLDLDLFHPVQFDEKKYIFLASLSEEKALSIDKRIIRTEGGKFFGHIKTYIFANSKGLLKSYNSSKYSIFCSVVADYKGRMERDYSYTISRSVKDLRSSDWIGQECARRVLSRLNPKVIQTMKTSVIFSAEVAINLFMHFSNAIKGSNVYQKSTFLFKYLNSLIFPEWLSIKEYPHIIKGLASAPFDNEGVKTSDRTIVKDGVLKTWLLNNYEARKIGLESTGHSGRIYNWYISYNDINFNDLLNQMGFGLIVTELIGEYVNITNGDYSSGIAGFLVKNGKIQYPVSGITIASNLKKMFENILGISNDLEKRNQIRCGSVLIKEMQIAGQ